MNSANRQGDSAELVIGLNNARQNSYGQVVGLIAENGGRLVNTVSISDDAIAVVVDMPLGACSSLVAQIRANDLARYVEPNMKFQTDLEPNDPDWDLQWGPQAIEAPEAWNTTIGNTSILVAVIDTGIEYDHEDLSANYVPLGYDWVNYDSDPRDDYGHGTHVAGTIAAVIDNGIGIAGLAQVRIMAEKALNSYGYGYEDDLADAIIHAVDQGADILSNSWGSSSYSQLIHDAIEYADSNGVLVIASAGNSGLSYEHYPAAYDEVIAVTATDQVDDPAYFTNYGEWVEVAAPGVDIYSTIINDSYEYHSGTSMAAPHVSGTAALIWSQYPNMTRDWVRAQLRLSADDLGDPGFDDFYGYGRINAKNAVEQAPPEHDLLIYHSERPRFIEPMNPAIFEATILNFGKNNESDLTVELEVNGTVVDSASIGFLASGTSATVDCTWSATTVGTFNVTLRAVPVPGEDVTANNALTEFIKVDYIETVLFKNYDPWLHPANEELLLSNGIPFDVFDSDEFGQVNLSSYSKVIIASDQDWSFYYDMETYQWWFEDYVSNGGMLEIHAADNGWNDGSWIGDLPGGLEWTSFSSEYVTIVDADHPVVSTPNYISDGELDNWYHSAHGYFHSYPDYSRVVIEEDFSGGPVYLEFDYGDGFIVASLQPLEWAYWLDFSQILENSLLHISTKYDHDLLVTMEVPTILEPGDSTFLNATVYNKGLNDEYDVSLDLAIDAVVVDTADIPSLLTGASYTLSYQWTPTVEAIYDVIAFAHPVTGENHTGNNLVTKEVTVRQIMGYVLFDQTHGTESVTYYNVWLADLFDNGYVVDTLTTTPITQSTLESYSVFITPQARQSYLSTEVSAISDFVLRGGGLLVIGDYYTSVYDALTRFAGITWTYELYGWGGYTYDITPHPVTEGVASAYLPSPSASMVVAHPAQNLIRDGYGYGEAMLAVSEIGHGSVMGIADENPLWDYYINNGDNRQLASNMIDWLAFRSPVASFTYLPRDPYVGETITFDASASFDPDGTVESCIWDFGDGESGDGSITTHDYYARGNYTVTLTVTDDVGLESTATAEMTVSWAAVEVEVEVGSIHFRGEMAEFYILVSSLGEPVNAEVTAILYFDGNLFEDLSASVESIDEGLYRIPYAIRLDAPPGAYTLLVEASYLTLSGTSIESFLLSSVLTGWSALLVDLSGDVGTIMTEIGSIKVMLNSVNATLVGINGRTATIEMDIGIVTADVDTINAKLTALNDTEATIQSDLGTITVDIDDIQLSIVDINGTVAIIQTSLCTLEGRVLSIDDDIATVETALGTVRVATDSGEEARQASETPLLMMSAVIIAIALVLMVVFMRRKA